jgi:hypothetical protein
VSDHFIHKCSVAEMADAPSFEPSPLAFITEIVRLMLATLRLMALVLEYSAEILDLSIQHVASAAHPNHGQVGTPRSVTPNPNQPEKVYSDMTPPHSGHSTVAVADPDPPTLQERHDTMCQHASHLPVPIFCDPKSNSRRFYCVTVGRQVGVFDNR